MSNSVPSSQHHFNHVSSLGLDDFPSGGFLHEEQNGHDLNDDCADFGEDECNEYHGYDDNNVNDDDEGPEFPNVYAAQHQIPVGTSSHPLPFSAGRCLEFKYLPDLPR